MADLQAILASENVLSADAYAGISSAFAQAEVRSEDVSTLAANIVLDLLYRAEVESDYARAHSLIRTYYADKDLATN